MPDDSVRALRQALGRLQVDAERFTPEAIAKAISWAKNNLILPDRVQAAAGPRLGRRGPGGLPGLSEPVGSRRTPPISTTCCSTWPRILRDNPEIRAGLDERYRFILVDEYQDTNLAQYAIARALSIDHPNLAVTGDPDQSIYGWRGANLNNILEFERDFPEVHVVRLEQNYRSTQRILAGGRRIDRPQRAAQRKGAVHRERPGRAGAAGRPMPRKRTRPRGSPPGSPRPSTAAAAGRAISPFSIASTP